MAIQQLKTVIDEAQYVKFIRNSVVAVWNGGHTINYYCLYAAKFTVKVKPVDCQNVGDFTKDEATLEEVKDGIENFELE